MVYNLLEEKIVIVEIVGSVQKLGVALLCSVILNACSEEPDPNFVRVVNRTGQPIDEVILYVDNSQLFGSLAPGDTTDYRYYPYDILDEPTLSVNIGGDTLYTYTYFLLT
ncbi:MAG: hypothetical protein AAF223_04195 [Bacteroidota bacterium]